MLNRLCVLQAPAGTYPIFNHPGLMNGYNEYIWRVSDLGGSQEAYFKEEVSKHMLALYVAGV